MLLCVQPLGTHLLSTYCVPGGPREVEEHGEGWEGWTSGLGETSRPWKEGVRLHLLAPSLFHPLPGTQAPGAGLDLSPKLEDQRLRR